MTKMKTQRGAKKRFKLTGTGRLRRRKTFHREVNTTRARERRGEFDVAPGDARHVKRLLGK